MTFYSNIQRTFRSVLPVAVLFFGVSQGLACQATNPEGQADVHQQRARLLAERICNPKLPANERLTDYGELSNLDVKTRDAAFATLVTSADESTAPMAAAALIRDKFEGVSRLLVPRISHWSDNSQLVVLDAVLFTREKEALGDIAREVVRASLATPTANAIYREGPLDIAAFILADSDTAGDHALLRSALISHPATRGLWLAMAASGGLGIPDAMLASSTYKDVGLPMRVRIAAAAALAPPDPNAAAFAVAGIKSFLHSFADQEIGEMLNAAQSDREAKKRLYELREDLPVLGTLLFLNTPSAESITFEFLSARNEEVRMILGLVAIARWPRRLLTLGQGVFTRDEYESLLAFLSIIHPDEASAVSARVSRVRLDELRSRLAQVGVVGVFGLPAMVAGWRQPRP